MGEGGFNDCAISNALSLFLPAIYSQIMDLKTTNPNVKIMIAVGGHGVSWQFTTMATTDATIDIFTDEAMAFMRHHGFDGIDMDWEYPSDSGQITRFTALMQVCTVYRHYTEQILYMFFCK